MTSFHICNQIQTMHIIRMAHREWPALYYRGPIRSHLQWWPKLLEHLADLKIFTYFAFKTWFNFRMFMKHALSTTNIKWSESYCLTLIFSMPTFCSNYRSTWLWHSVNIFPENFNTNVVPWILQLTPKTFLSMYKICPVYFPTRPKFARWGWGLNFEGGSPSFSVFQQIPSLVGSSGNSLFCKFNKNNWNLLNMPSVLIVLATNDKLMLLGDFS